MDNLFIITQLVERAKLQGKHIHLGFIDLRKAYDKVCREILWEKLSKLGLHKDVVGLLQQLYKCHRRKVFTIGGWSKWIDGEIGVKQGCVLSPLLFALFINDILEEVKQIGRIEVGNGKISGLLFVDDIVLMGDTEEELRQQIHKIMDYVAKQELEVNLTKSKVMICTNSRKRKGNGENEDIKDKIEGIQETSSYNYLGIHLGNNRPF